MALRAVVALLVLAGVTFAVMFVEVTDSKDLGSCNPLERLGSVPEMAAGRPLSCMYFIQVGDIGYAPSDCKGIKPSLLGDRISRGDTNFARRIEGVPAATALAVLDLNAGPRCDGWQRWEALGPIE